MLMLSRHTAPVARRRPAAAYAAGATRTAAHVRTRTLPGSQVGRRTAPAPLFATKDPRDARESDYGSNEVPESWQDEWVSGNTHIDQEGRSAPSGGGESGSKGMAARRSSTAPTPRSSQPSRRNDEVPESWQDEWVSGNTHMEREDKSAASPGGGRTDSERMASRSGVNMTAAGESLAGGLGSREAAAMEATRQAAGPEGAGEGAGVQDIE